MNNKIVCENSIKLLFLFCTLSAKVGVVVSQTSNDDATVDPRFLEDFKNRPGAEILKII